MDICQEYKVFLQRNGKLLMFKKHDLYDGDSHDVERYINKGSLRYIFINKTADGVEQNLYYFANTYDQYVTQFGEWVHIEESFNMPATDLVKFILRDYYSDGQYSSDIRIVTVQDGEFAITTI